MLCGLEWWAKISKKNAYRIVKYFDLDRKLGSRVRKERRINENEKSWIRTGTAECFFIEVKKVNGCDFELKVRGSLHKFFHGNNHGLFKGLEVLAAIDGMSNLFEVEPCNMQIKNLEVGLNLPVTFLVFPYLKSNLLYHKKKLKEEFKDKGIGFYFDHDDYLIKFYQKQNFLLRFEVKLKSKDKLQVHNISTVVDLNESSINSLTNCLLPEFRQTDMRGKVDLVDIKGNPNNLTAREREKLLRFSSVYYQQEHSDKLKQARKASNTKKCNTLQKQANRLRKECFQIVSEKGDKVHKEIELRMAEIVSEFQNSWE